MSDSARFITPAGDFTVARRNAKVDVPCFGADPYACDCKLGRAGICYARLIVDRYATAKEAWQRNEAILDELKPGELYDLFKSVLRWTRLKVGARRFRGWVAGEPSITAARQLAEAAADFKHVRVWIPSATLRQDMLSKKQRTMTVIRSSLGNGKAAFSSQVIKCATDVPAGEVVCPHHCGPCTACWDKKVKRVNYVEHR